MFRAAGFTRVEHAPYVYSDATDGSLNALHIDARRLADPGYLRNTSLWHRVDPGIRARAVHDLARDLDSGEFHRRVGRSIEQAHRHGHGTVFAGWP